ncbi:MAG TPA: PadR family transcriptional regulator [Kofleriaceae bacterium]|jgi:DNA-binding PadR family transcriptional regulator
MRLNNERLRGRHRRRGHDDNEHEGRGRRRLRHGEVRLALMLALQDGAAHGYELGQRLERASGGSWRPSPGSIYPTLQALADEDMVSSEDRDGKRVFSLTRKGTAAIKAREERGEEAPWHGTYDGPAAELREAGRSLKQAIRQVMDVGTADQCAKAKTIVIEARRQVYELLARE